MAQEEVPLMAWLYIIFGVFSVFVLAYVVSVAIDVELWYREIQREKKRRS